MEVSKLSVQKCSFFSKKRVFRSEKYCKRFDNVLPYKSVKHTEDIVLRLLRIREARRLSESPLASSEDVQVLRSFIIENRRQIPSFALSHFDRLEAGGTPGLAAVENGRCSSCGTAVPADEIEYLEKNKNIGVCDGCFCFLYLPDEKFCDDGFFKRLLHKE